MFPSPTGRVLNHATTLTDLLHGLGIDAVAHGFRSSFRDRNRDYAVTHVGNIGRPTMRTRRSQGGVNDAGSRVVA